MSDNLNRGIRDFSKYDTMGIEELEEILRLDAEAPEGVESDTELLLYVMEVLARRRNNSIITGNTAQEAWESFQKNYMPGEYLGVEPKKKSKRIVAPWVRRLISTAAVIALIVFIPISAKALGLDDIWSVFAHWAKETFSFVSGSNTAVSEPNVISEEAYSSLQNALEKSNRNPNLIPTWIPDGFVLEKIEKDVTPIQERYRAFYSNNGKALEIFIQVYINTDPRKLEQNDNLIEVYESNNIDFYIFTNFNQIRAVWITENFESYITGDVSLEEIKQMIDSIKEG